MGVDPLTEYLEHDPFQDDGAAQPQPKVSATAEMEAFTEIVNMVKEMFGGRVVDKRRKGQYANRGDFRPRRRRKVGTYTQKESVSADSKVC